MSPDEAELQKIAEELYQHYPQRKFVILRKLLANLCRRQFLRAKALARKKRKGQA